jgi:SAM-dependent methyltransferase
MATSQIADIEGLKARVKATWMAGDYARIAEATETVANEFIARRHLQPNTRMLDVACGTGNLCFPAAKAGAIVTVVDIAPNLLDQARSRAAREGVAVTFDEGDADNCRMRAPHSTLSSVCLVRCSPPVPRLSHGSLPVFAVLAGKSRWRPGRRPAS